jgi:hypothetical protein
MRRIVWMGETPRIETMKLRIVTNKLLLTIVCLWSATLGRCLALDCVTISPLLHSGGYASTCPEIVGLGPVGWLDPDPCEYRGFVTFEVPASNIPYPSGELRLSVHSSFSPLNGARLELHAVSTSLQTLTNYSGNRQQVFADLADGELLGSLDLGNLASPPDGTGLDLQVVIPLTDVGLARVNASRGLKMAFGLSLAKPEGASRVNGIVRFLGDSTSGQHLILRKSEAIAPAVAVLNVVTQAVAGSTRSISAVACGSGPLTTQWVKDGVELPGQTNEILILESVLPEHSGVYQLRASNTIGIAVSDPIKMEVLPLALLLQPSEFTASDGVSGYCLYAVVRSLVPASFQWFFNGQIIPNSPSPFRCFDPITLADAGRYQLVGSNAFGSVTSSVAVVTVTPVAPSLESYPSGTARLAVGQAAEFYSFASGSSPISYQWLKGAAPIVGATGNRLVFREISASDAGNYQVVASNPYGSSTSQVFRIEVVPALFNGPLDVTGAEASRLMLWSQPVAMSGTSFQWYREGTPVEGAKDPFLIREPLSSVDVGRYFVVASNSYGMVTSAVARVELYRSEPSVSLYASEAMPVPMGDDFVLAALVSGAPSPRLQWRRDGVDIPGATNLTLSFPAATSADEGEYTVRAINSYGVALSAGFAVTVTNQPPRLEVVPVNPTESLGSLVTLQSRAIGGLPLTYQWRKSGGDLPGETNAALTLPKVKAEDAGNYEIVARNSVGEARHPFTLQVRAKTPLDQWDWILPYPQGNRLLDIASGGGRLVAVGRSGNVVTSTDGGHWERAIVDADCDLLQVAYGNGLFVAIGVTRAPTGMPGVGGIAPSSIMTGIVLISADGLTWSPGQSPSPFPTDIAFGNGVFVMAGSPSGATPVFNFTSVDGIHWTPQYHGWTRSYLVQFVNGEFWASDQGLLYRSADGKNWRPALRNLLGESTGFLAFGNGRYVAVGQYGQFGQTSTDSENWMPFVTTPQGLQSLAFGNGRFVATLFHDDETPTPNATPPAGTIITSEDGRLWTQRDSKIGQELESVIFADGRFWAVGEAGTISSSVDGIVWTPSPAATDIDYYGLTQKGDLIIAVGDDGTILTSTDSQTWTRQSTPSGRNLHAVHAAADIVVAGGRGGRIMTSPDAVRWTTRESATTNYVQRITWDGQWVGVCEGGDIIRSANGTDWSAVRTFPASDHEGVAYGDGYWLAVGGYFRLGESGSAVSTVFYSTDAIHWYEAGINVGVRLRDVVFGNGKFVAVGNDGMVVILTVNPALERPIQVENSYSVNQYSVFTRSYVNFRRIRFSEGLFMAVGNDGVMVSSRDLGLEWLRHRSRTSQNLHDILPAADASFYTVGNNG